MKKSNFFVGILISIVGFLLLIIPRQCVKAVVILLGIEAIANGIYSLMYTRKLVPDSSFQLSVFIRGMLSLVVGLLAFFLPMKFMKAIEAIWSIMLYILALYLIASSLLEMFAMGKLRETEIDRNQYILEAVISIIAAVIMFIVPLKIGTAILRLGGFLVMIIGLLYLFYTWKNRPIIQEPVEVVDDISGEIES